MSKLQIRVTILFLAATLAALGVVSIAPGAEADVGTEVESGMELKVRDADFLRHNYASNPQGAQAKAAFERRVDTNFLRHNYATPSSAAVVAAAGSPQTQSDPEPIIYRQNKR